MKLQKLGGYAAIAGVCVYIAAYIPMILSQRRFGDVSDPVKIMAAYSTAPGYGQAIALLSIICFFLLMVWVGIALLRQKLPQRVSIETEVAR